MYWHGDFIVWHNFFSDWHIFCPTWHDSLHVLAICVMFNTSCCGIFLYCNSATQICQFPSHFLFVYRFICHLVNCIEAQPEVSQWAGHWEEDESHDTVHGVHSTPSRFLNRAVVVTFGIAEFRLRVHIVCRIGVIFCCIAFPWFTAMIFALTGIYYAFGIFLSPHTQACVPHMAAGYTYTGELTAQV